jgi:hypothetical protein
MTANLEQLIAGHAYWSDRRLELKNQFAIEISKCNGMQKGKTLIPHFLQTSGSEKYQLSGISCFQHAYLVIKEGYHPIYPDDVLSFEEIWSGMHEHGDGIFWEPCEYCKTAHATRLEKVKASRHIGAIRAAITRVGRNMEYNSK